MLIERRDDFIEKMWRACGLWKRKDTALALSLKGINMLAIALEITSDPSVDIRDLESGYSIEEWYSDEELERCYELIKVQDTDLRQKLMAYAEKRNPRAKATDKQQLRLF